MIDRQEILEFARELSLAPHVVEKDYVLGWLLAGIAAHPMLGEQWIFKGGTCLKKCYFETYRFSEDLDFTVKDADTLIEATLVGAFKEITDWVYDRAGIELPADTQGFELYPNPRGHIAVQGRVGYRGPLGRRGDPPRVKLDLTADEMVVLEPEIRAVHHPYTDQPEDGVHILCYPFEEVFAEKLRALMERQRPRDLYDVVHLFRHDEVNADRAAVHSTLLEKCRFKGMNILSFQELNERPKRTELEAEWSNMLAHQLPVLPPFLRFWEELPTILEWLMGTTTKAARAAYPVTPPDLDTTWKPPAMVQAWHVAAPLESIRFAAANRLLVDLEYQGSRRLIEPYSLRRTRAGHLLLLATRHEDGQARSYRVDRIQGVDVTGRSYTPRYAIELSSTGQLTAPPRRRLSSSLTPRATREHPKSFYRSPQGPTYVVQCTTCGKRFNRKRYDIKIKAHKSPSGSRCFGRMGFLLETKY